METTENVHIQLSTKSNVNHHTQKINFTKPLFQFEEFVINKVLLFK